MAWQTVGTITCNATSSELVIGAVTLPPFNGLEIKVTQIGGQSPWPFSYGLLWVENSFGRELGTIKVYGHTEGDVYRLGAGLSSLLGGGLLKFSPRLYNLRWLKASGQTWTLRFDYDKPATNLPQDRYRSPGFEREDGFGISVVAAGNLGRLLF
jgi:hypothetical protein